MPDRSTFWSPPPEWRAAVLAREGLCIAACEPVQAWRLSGDVGSCLADLQLPAALGPRDAVAGERYALRLAPDSVLLVLDARLSIAPGWDDRGWAMSDVSDGLLLLDIDGPDALRLMQAGSEYAFDAVASRPMESARMLFAGLRVVVARRSTGWRLHVDRAWAPALWRWLDTHLQDNEGST